MSIFSCKSASNSVILPVSQPANETIQNSFIQKHVALPWKCLFIRLYVCVSICPFVSLSIYPFRLSNSSSVHPSVCFSLHLSYTVYIYTPIHRLHVLSTRLSSCLQACLSVCFSFKLIYLYFPPSFHLTVGCFCPVGLSLLLQHFQ